jgi:hypothetical protein
VDANDHPSAAAYANAHLHDEETMLVNHAFWFNERESDASQHGTSPGRIGFSRVSLSIGGFAESSPQQVAGSNWQALTADSPAVIVGVKNDRFIAWRGLDNKIYFAELSGSMWTSFLGRGRRWLDGGNRCCSSLDNDGFSSQVVRLFSTVTGPT